MYRNVYGERLGLLAQLEITYDDGSTERITTDDQWRSATGPYLASDLYNGETYDARLELDGWDSPGFDDVAWPHVELFEPAVGALVAPPGPPVRRVEERVVQEVITTPEGRTVLDFGQNLVGRVRFTVSGEAGTTVTLRHAEVLEHGEPAYRPLRNAKATDHYTLRGGGAETYEPEFTFHGFRYAEVEGWPGALNPDDFVAVVLHSDMERTGWFECNNELVNQLHSNVVWGMRGNFLDVPTDCPQRDERLGWTGDLQVFAPTAAYLYDTAGMLGNWMADLCAEQRPNGTVPVVIPHVETFLSHSAAWSDAVTIVPQALHTAYGDLGVLGDTLANMRAWVDFVAADARADRVWTNGFQLGDWLDPNAPAEAPFMGKTDPWLVATAYFARSAQIVSDVAALVGPRRRARRVRATRRRGARRLPPGIHHTQRASDERLGHRLRSGAGVRADRRPGGRRTRRSALLEGGRIVAIHDRNRVRGNTAGAARVDAHRQRAVRIPAAHPASLPVVVVLSRHGRHHDLGAVEQHVARRFGEPGRHDVVQPLRRLAR